MYVREPLPRLRLALPVAIAVLMAPLDVAIAQLLSDAFECGDLGAWNKVVPAPGLVGDDCAGATQLILGAPVATSTAGYQNDIETDWSCTYTFSNSGRDRVYAVSLPPWMRVTVVATPAPGFDVAVYILPAGGCGLGVSCLAGSDSFGEGGQEVIWYTNSTMTVVDLFVVLDSWRGSVCGGELLLQASIGPP